MNLVSAQMAKSLAGGSMIRRMFEAGNELKKKFGEDAVCDFSLGNPDLAPPVQVSEEFRSLAVKSREPASLGYMSNAGFPWALDKLAAWLGEQQKVELTRNEVMLSCGAAGLLMPFSILCWSRGMRFSPLLRILWSMDFMLPTMAEC